MNKRIGLSKSRIALFEQCPRRLWLAVHRPELAEVSAATWSGFADGHRVGALACTLHPDGIMIDGADGLSAALDRTGRLMASAAPRPVFEATFVRDGVLVRVDLMLPTPTGWHVAEVKNTTGVKAYHLGDLATQLWVLRGNDVVVSRASIRHIDRSFILTRDGDYAGLFVDTDISGELEPIIAIRQHVVAAARDVVAGEEPLREMGPHCDEPFACSFKRWCGRADPAPPSWPIALLPGIAGKTLAARLTNDGIADLTTAPAEAMNTVMLARIHTATVSGTPYHDIPAIVAETAGWAYPRTFLDFETIQFAIPRWLGTRPFEQLPFQFSAHVLQAGGAIDHREFLSIDGADPRRACAEALVTLPTAGAVIAWNAPFECRCLLGLADRFADLAGPLRSLADRLVDLLPVARRHYHHRDMRGSWSLKAVLPTLGLAGYDTLGEVRSGTDAQTVYLEAIDPATSPSRCEELRTALLAYCARDTEAMLLVLDQLTDHGR